MKHQSSPAPSRNSSTEFHCFHLPATLLGLLVIFLAGLASLRHPFGPWLPFIGIATIVGVLIVASRMRREWIAWPVAGAAVWLVLADAARSLKVWKFVSSNPDAWSYGADADYLTNHSRGLSTGMTIFDQWASHLQNSRFASPGLLAVCGWLTGHDRLIEEHALFYAGVLSTLFFSLAHLGFALGLERRTSLILGFFGTCAGWTSNALIVGNYDNLVYVALFPSALASWIAVFNGQMKTRSFLFHASIVTSALFYAYPEGLVLSGALLLPLVAAALWKMQREPPLLKLTAGASALAIGLAAPYLPVFWPFVTQQIHYGTSLPQPASRPGSGNFPGLLDTRFGPAFWSLGTEYPGAPSGFLFLILSIGLLVLAGIGVWQLGRKNPWFPWVALTLGGLLFWQACLSSYDYGTYKVIFCAQWWVFSALISGGVWLASRCKHAWVTGLLTPLLVSGVVWERWNLRNHRVWPPEPIINAAAELPGLQQSILGSRPVLLDIDDATGQMWALAFLRDHRVALVRPKGYLGMPGPLPLLALAKPEPITADMFTLRSSRELGAIWSNSHFSLFPTPAGAVITSVDNPNGLETSEGEPLIWIAATQPTVFLIKAFHDGDFLLSGTRLIFGPSGVSSSTHPLEIVDASGTHHFTLKGGDLTFPIVLKSGLNRVTVRSTATITSTKQVNSDTRELMVMMTGYFVKSASPAQPSPR